MPCLHEVHAILGAIERTEDAVDAVAWIPVDPRDAPETQPLDQEISHRVSHNRPRRKAQIVNG
jgi:hypothetical protein